MVLGSMVAFSGPAHAIPGELTVGPLAGSESFIDIGTGTIEVRGNAFGSTPVASPWTTASLDLEEAPGSCFEITINVPGDVITWVSTVATQALAPGSSVVIDGDACGFTNGICELTLNEGITLTSTNWANNIGNYTGTFTDDGATAVGGFDIGNIVDCRSSGLADSIWTALMATSGPPSPLPWGGTSPNIIDIEMHKVLSKF